MQLRDARLCLDCEEVHDESHCPVCASEAFTYVARWVPSAERRPQRPVGRPPSSAADVTASSSRRVSRLVTGGALGFAALATARWLLRGPGTSGTRGVSGDGMETGASGEEQ